MASCQMSRAYPHKHERCDDRTDHSLRKLLLRSHRNCIPIERLGRVERFDFAP